jgi:hypothetical protein
MPLGERQVDSTRYRTILREYFNDHCRRLQIRKPGKVTTRLGTPRLGRRAFGLRHNGKDMTGLSDIGRPRIGCDRRA